ncbi:MAG: dimethylarginine dimethylaminohydrolase family protein [Promethearchaeota archaeon]
MLNYAIVRKPAKNFQDGITSSNLGKPDYEKTKFQHSLYIEALKKCNLKIIKLKADERFPDSTFIEDTAVVNKDIAIITNLGVTSRKGEEVEISTVLKSFYDNIETIKSPGTLEGGDILRVENQYFIGLSKRTNKEGARQIIKILKKYDYSCKIIPLVNVLHLKTGISYIGNDNMVVSGEFIVNPIFKRYNLIQVPKDESYAANCIKINNFVLIPKGFKKLNMSVINLGYKTIEIEMSEFRKMDGGLSCLSIRF